MSRETALLKLHERCSDILDMAIKANNRKADAERTLKVYTFAKWDAPTRLFNTETGLQNHINRWQKIHKRLMQYHSEVFSRLNNVYLKS